MNIKIKRSLLAGSVILACGNALGAEYWLCAGTFNQTMPDSSTVTMWGYADASNILPNHTCPANGNAAYTAPGPQLNIPVGDTSLTIHLTNNLSEPSSLVIPGQTETAMVPFKIGNRVRSFTHEVQGGSSGDYIWNNLKSGSYIYQTGTHPAKQVQMGLYGALVKDSAVNTAYPGITYTSQVIQFLSEIDPILHSRVANNTYGQPCASATEQKTNPCSSTISYNPKWFLVNGKVFVDPLPAAPTTIPAGTPGGRALIRFFNMGLRSHSMILQGASMKLVAEDGHVLPVAHDQYSLMIAAGKTHDALFTPPTSGTYPLYERMHNLSAADSVGNIKTGGLMSFLNVGAGNQAPIADNDAYAVTFNTLLTVTAAQGVLNGDTDADIPAQSLIAQLVTSPTKGILSLGLDGSFAYNPNSGATGTDTFTYQANDQQANNNLSNIATVTLTINGAPANQPPVFTSTAPTSAVVGVPYAYTVSATDPEGNVPITYSLVSGPAGMSMTGNTVSWTPTSTQSGLQTFTVRATDSLGASSTQVTTGVSVAVNQRPTVNAGIDQTITLPALANLNATVIDDGRIAPITATWTVRSGPGPVIFGDAAAIDTTAKFTYPGVYILRLTAFDGQHTVFDEMRVTVRAPLYFSTRRNINPPGVNGTADDSDIYYWNGTAFSRRVDVSSITRPVPTGANVDGLQYVDATHFYLSFADNVTLPVLGTLQDEDIVYYNNGVWSVFFDGTAKGLTNNNHDIDAFSINGSNIYFSTLGNTNPPGVTGTADDADIYLWNGSAFSRVVDVTTIGVPAVANLDALEFVDATHFGMSFNTEVNLPTVGQTSDETVSYYNNGQWFIFFNGLNNAEDGAAIDAMDIP